MHAQRAIPLKAIMGHLGVSRALAAFHFSMGRSTFSVGRTGAFHFFRRAFHFFPAEKRNEKRNGVSV